MSEQSRFPDMEVLAKRVMELLGGPKKYHAAAEADFYAMKAKWNKDVNLMGRVLRAHLHVEHYMTEYLRQAYPNAASWDEARFTFAQKVVLIQGPTVITELLPGIRRLNKIRNRMAHDLDAGITNEDADFYLAQPMFKAMREAGGWTESDPLSILEKFAEFASTLLHSMHGTHARAVRQALDELNM